MIDDGTTFLRLKKRRLRPLRDSSRSCVWSLSP